ncbi:MAG: hypothetical protein PHI36_04920 [Bacteroidales bacterium]|jgi:hypothetical protein|nr:hypothetical protein [Bacteroidales bacterium]MDD4575750.1 hypothetical protein [Bacteroidales bacterium]
MKKTIRILVLLLLFTACNSGHQESEIIDSQISDTNQEEEIADILYTQYPLAFLSKGELYFYNFDDAEKVKFEEESSAIINFSFDTEGKILYYNVEHDNSLWLKSANINEPNPTPELVVDWKLKKDDCITETYDEESPLIFTDGKLIMQYGFSWETYNFTKMAIYSINNNKINRKEYDYRFIQKSSGELTINNEDKYIQKTDNQLYYIYNKAKNCLTDKLDFEALRIKENEDYWVDIDFCSFSLSPDKTKILFGAILEYGDLPHGHYCIANTNGSNQMILKQTDLGSNKNPIWLKSNSLVFVDQKNNLYMADNDKNSIQKIAENVTFYAAR